MQHISPFLISPPHLGAYETQRVIKGLDNAG